MVGFAISLSGWVDVSWLSSISVVCVVGVSFIRILAVGVRVCLTTVVVIFIARTNFVALRVVFFSFEMTAQISVVTWLFAMVTCRLGVFGVWFCEMMRHSICLLFIGGFKTV